MHQLAGLEHVPDDEPGPDAGAPRLRRLVLLVGAIVLVDTMFFAAIAPLLPEYSDRLDLSKAEAGVLSASYAIGALVGSLPAGWLAALLGRAARRAAGLAVLAVSSVVFGFADSVWLLDLARFAQGAGGRLWAGGLAWLMAAAPRGRAPSVLERPRRGDRGRAAGPGPGRARERRRVRPDVRRRRGGGRACSR